MHKTHTWLFYVETAIDWVKASKRQSVKTLDVGTGSGCIAISLAKFLPDAQVDAIDISEEALSLAKHNAVFNNVNINFILGDLFAPGCCLLPTAYYDFIITNPPYIPTAEIETLQAEIQYEPRAWCPWGAGGRID